MGYILGLLNVSITPGLKFSLDLGHHPARSPKRKTKALIIGNQF